MTPGQVVRHRKQTTHYLHDGHVICARDGWRGTAVVTETTADGHHTALHVVPTRDEAEVLAAAYAAARSHTTTDRTEA